MNDLVVLDDAADARAAAILRDFPNWPCRKGCDGCCRNLSRMPILTREEWVRLRGAVERLDEPARRQVRARIAALSDETPIVCPVLDLNSGSCLTYASRPVACRTYGFYADRDGGLCCDQVSRFAENLPDVVWGNQEAVECRLDGFGERKSLREWFDDNGSCHGQRH